jgi:hypothetical protein
MKKKATMYHSVTFISTGASVILSILIFTLTGCGIIFIPDTSGITSFPDHYNQIVDADDRIYIDFPFQVEKLSVETLFTVESSTSPVEGYYTWEGTTCYFDLLAPLTYGSRYVLTCIGDVKDTQSRPYPVNIEIPFFYITDNAAPFLLSDIIPEEGDIILPSSVLTITFSNPVNEYSFKKGFSVVPDTTFMITNDDQYRSFYIEPFEEWANLTSYTITLSQDIVDRHGIPLVREYTSTFFVMAGTTQPVVTGVVPAHKDWISHFPPIRIEFSEGMDKAKTGSAVSLTPTLSYTTTWTDEMTFILIPEKGFVMEREYTITMTQQAENIHGIPIPDDVIIRFIPDIQPLILDRIGFEEGEEIHELS